MKVIYHSKRTKRSVYLKDNGVVVKTGIQAIGSQEADIQRRAHAIGIAPKVFTANKDSIEMEFVGGWSLNEYLKMSGIDKPRIVRLVKIAENTLYDNCISHGDFTGDNIRITPDGRVVIIDYGSAKLTGEPVLPRLRHHYNFT